MIYAAIENASEKEKLKGMELNSKKMENEIRAIS